MDLIVGRMEIAVAHGADVAIFIHNVIYWTEKNRANNRHYHQGNWWTYNSAAAFAELFPLWSKDQIKRIIKRCREGGLLLVEQLSDDRHNRINWYAPTADVWALYGAPLPEVDDSPDDGAESPNASVQNRPMDEGKIAECIYSNKGLPAKVLPPIVPPQGDTPQPKAKKKRTKQEPWKSERFDAFWEYYSEHVCADNKAGAHREWNKMRLPDQEIDSLARKLTAQVKAGKWAGRSLEAIWYLRDRRFDDPVTSPRVGPAEEPRLPEVRFGVD